MKKSQHFREANQDNSINTKHNKIKSGKEFKEKKWITKKSPSTPSQSGSSNFFITATEKIKILEERKKLNKSIPSQKHFPKDIQFERDKLNKTKPTQKHYFRYNQFKPDKIQYNANGTAASKKKGSFNKKNWRLQKYSKKYKLEQWEEKRKQIVLREYYKQLKNDATSFKQKKVCENYYDIEENKSKVTHQVIPGKVGNLNIDPDFNKVPGKKLDALTVGTKESPKNQNINKNSHTLHTLRTVGEEKKKRKEEMFKRKKEKETAIKEYKSQKLERFKKLSKRTSKGQPVMKYRMQMLLEQIQKSLNK